MSPPVCDGRPRWVAPTPNGGHALELSILINIVRRWWWLILIPIVITTALALPELLNRGGAASGGFSTMISYSAAQSMEAIPRTDGDYQDIWRASELTVDAFTDWVRGSAFAQAVADVTAERGVTIDPRALVVNADNEGVVGRVYLNWSNADELQAITDASIRVLQTRSQDYFAQLGGEPAAVTLLHQSPITAAPPPLTDRFGSLLRIGIGVIAGLGLAILAHALDPILRRRDDVEQLGFKILGTIPKR